MIIFNSPIILSLMNNLSMSFLNFLPWTFWIPFLYSENNLFTHHGILVSFLRIKELTPNYLYEFLKCSPSSVLAYLSRCYPIVTGLSKSGLYFFCMNSSRTSQKTNKHLRIANLIPPTTHQLQSLPSSHIWGKIAQNEL